MYHIKNTILAAAFMLLCLLHVKAQNEPVSPYSSYGIGIVNRSSNGILDAMGGVSYAMQNPYYINFRNPASYAAFDSLSFVADAGASLYSSRMQQNGTTQRNTYAKPGYLAIGLPVTRHWRTSLGITPFSSVGYTIESSSHIENVGKVDYIYSGTGGVNRLYWGNAFKICKGLSIGLNADYMFGTIYAGSNTEFEGNNLLNTFINDIYKVNGIYLTGGIQYFFNIGEKNRVGLGLTYGNTAYIWAKEQLMINSYSGGFVSTTTYDTVLYRDDLRGSLKIPQSVGAGVSYTYDDKMTVAADVTWQDWKNYRFMKQADSLKNSLTASVGIQYIPNPLSTKFFRRMAFRAGGKYSTGELQIRNKPITELGVCIGVGIPLNTFNTHSSINLMLEYGKTGTLASNLVLQNYFKVSLCFTLQERWYQRVKLD
ncbi:MAG: hypothetical protein SPL42_07385 [Bacteroidales bacterium]|nr:hypothetical protein [Bacteroidales bacterium]MDY6348231.1 hypothetical protein [Bacteroidales bacterium]